MKTRHPGGIALILSVILVAPQAFGAGRIVAVPQPTRQAPPPGTTTFGVPNPAGLPPVGVPNLSAPGVPAGSPAIDAGIATPTVPGGGGGTVIVPTGSSGGTNAMGGSAGWRGPLSAVDIARAFLEADANHDGDLSRAEASRLGIALPVPFDELDRNHDGVLSRFEYDDAFQ